MIICLEKILGRYIYYPYTVNEIFSKKILERFSMASFIRLLRRLNCKWEFFFSRNASRVIFSPQLQSYLYTTDTVDETFFRKTFFSIVYWNSDFLYPVLIVLFIFITWISVSACICKGIRIFIMRVSLSIYIYKCIMAEYVCLLWGWSRLFSNRRFCRRNTNATIVSSACS